MEMSNGNYFISQSEGIRFPLLLVEWIFSFICFEIALIFLIRYIKQRQEKQQKELVNLQELGYASLFMGFSIMWFFFIIGDYYSSVEVVSPFLIWSIGSMRYLFLNCGYLSLMVGAFLFILLMEKYKVYLVRKYFFSACFLTLIVIFIIFFFIDIQFTQDLTFAFWPLFFLFFLIYIVDFVRKVQTRQSLVRGLLKFLPGFLLLAIGFMFTTDFMIDALGLEFRLVGSILQILAIFSISFFFITLPPFAEFDWRNKIEHLFIIDKAGICLYNKTFDETSEIMDENLISGAISSINLMLKELTADEGVSVIKKKGKAIIIFPSKFIAGVMFCKEDLNFIKLLLKDLIDKFELIYHHILLDWDGDVTIFKPTEKIVNEIFLK